MMRLMKRNNKNNNQGSSHQEKNETTTLIKHIIEIVSLLLVGIGGFVIVMYLKPITAQDNEITHNFNQVTGYVRNIQKDINWLNTACTKPINYDKADQYQTDLGLQDVKLVHDFHDKLGLLISPQTYCNLRQITSAVDQSSNSKNPCYNIPSFTEQQINNLINEVNFDKNNFNSYIEFFKKNRDTTHDDSICNDNKR